MPCSAGHSIPGVKGQHLGSFYHISALISRHTTDAYSDTKPLPTLHISPHFAPFIKLQGALLSLLDAAKVKDTALKRLCEISLHKPSDEILLGRKDKMLTVLARLGPF